MDHKLFTLFILLSFTAQSQSLLTKVEVFDFRLGDEFHYTNAYAPPNGKRKTVIAIDSSANGDTIIYSFLNDKYTSTPEFNPGYYLKYQFYVDTTHIWLILSDSLSLREHDANFLIDSSFSVASCGRTLNSYEVTFGTFEPNDYKAEYGRGLGRTYYYSYITSNLQPRPYEEEMIFYKKGNDSCGTPDRTNIGLGELKEPPLLKIYPNPVQEVLNLELAAPGQVKTVKIYSATGKLLHENALFSSQVILDMSSIPTGMFIIQVESSTGESHQLLQKL